MDGSGSYASILIDGIPSATIIHRGHAYWTNGFTALRGTTWKFKRDAISDIKDYINKGTLPGDNDETAGNNINPPLCSTEEAEGGTTDQRVASAARHSERKRSLVAKDQLIDELLTVVEGLTRIMNEEKRVLLKSYCVRENDISSMDAADREHYEEINGAVQHAELVIEKARGEK